MPSMDESQPSTRGVMNEITVRQDVTAFLRSNIIYDDTRVIDDDESFLASGILDSTGILELIGFLEDTYGITFQDEELVAGNFDTLSRLSSFVLAKTKDQVKV